MTSPIEHDRNLQQRLEHEISTVLPYGSAHIGVAVCDGVATLSGWMLQIAEKRAVIDATHALGVRVIADDIHIAGGGPRPSDSDVAVRLQRALAHAGALTGDGVNAVVRHGAVLLKRAAPSEDERVLAERITAHVRGVDAVTNDIIVTEPSA